MADFSLIFKLCTYSLKMFIPYRSKYANLFDSIELKKVSLILYLSGKSVKGINRDFKLSQIQRKTRNVTQTEKRTESIGCCFSPLFPMSTVVPFENWSSTLAHMLDCIHIQQKVIRVPERLQSSYRKSFHY